MAGTASEESAGGRSLEGLSSGQRCQSGEVLAEWRSCEQMENGTPSTSPPYWDTDDSDDDGPKPAELYGKHTWKIEKFSQINKRELRSNAFEVGGYKWYILIYPQGCDVSNHLSLFLCVANHDKLLPGWSHFAQFTIAVVNKDPKKSKYSDTLHRFWKKEHDWGWKKFMELTKISDGFVDSDTLIIKAQVQVIREKADRPFRCLDCQYRRELVRVYLTNVEQICRRFVEDRRSKLGKLLEDNDKWSSFCSFWLGIDQNARRRMSREKMDMILKVIVKQFFIEKEVTSTLVMDSLYSGLKALEGQSKCIKGKARLTDGEDMPAPVVRVEKNMFVLVDDVLLLLERAAMEPLPPKDEKGPQNRTKDGSAGDDFNKDSIERDERRLTELGRRTVEIFVLAHIFSNKIEAAYQEAVALKRQEELIREEKAESEQKAKRGMAEKEKKSKKKQAKQKRNRKAKDVKLKDERADLLAEDKGLNDNAVEDDKVVVESRNTVEKDDILEDASDVSDLVDYGADNLQPDSEDRDVSPVNWDTDASEVNTNNEANCMRACNGILTVQYGVDKRNSSTMDDSSSTCSTDSAPSVVTNGSYRVNASTNNNKSQKSPTRAKNQRGKVKSRDMNGTNGVDNQRSDSVVELERRGDVSPSQKAVEASGSEAVVSSSQESMKFSEHNIVKKVEEVVVLQRRPAQKSQVENDRQSKEKASMVSHSPVSPPKCTVTAQHKYEPKIGASTAVHLTSRKTTSDSVHQQIEKPTGSCNMPQTVNVLKPDSVRTSLAKPTEKPSPRQQAPPSLISRPASAPIIPGTRQGTVPVVSVAPALQNPQLGRSASVTTQSAPDPSPSSSAHSFVPQSYRNAIVGSNLGSSSGLSHPPVSSLSSMPNQPTTPSSPAPSPSPSPSSSPSVAMSQQPAQSAGPYYVSQNYDRLELGSVGSRISFGASARDVVVQNGGRRQWLESQQQHRDANSTRNMTYDPPLSMLSNEIGNLDIYTRPISTTPNSRSYEYLRSSDFSASTSGAQPTQQGGGLADDDFPHIDIINELLDDEQGFTSGPANLQNHRFPSYQSDMDISGDLGPSPYGSCRFERSRSYHDDFLQPDQYAGSSLQGNHYDSLRDYLPQGNTMMPYLNGQIDGLVPNQWQVGGTDHLSMLNNMSSNGGNGDGYPYNIQEYSNLASGLNGGYTMFRPSSGH